MNIRLLLSLPAASLLALIVTGCGFTPSPAAPSTNFIAPVQGKVFGGQQPVTGSQVYLYATGTSGVGLASTSVLTSAVLSSGGGVDRNNHYYVTTDANGNFSITGDYTCTTGQSLYLYATGGNSGAGTGSNPHIGLLAALGTCASSSGDLSGTVPFVTVNEVSTIATAYALAGFATSPTSIGSGSGANAVAGMSNAIANVPNVMSYTTGLPLATTPHSTKNFTGTVPANKILWLADILASCVSTAPTDPTSACANLFAAVPGPTGAVPSDTAQVALNLAHTLNASTQTITTLTNLIPAQAAFSYTPTTWTDLALPVVYTTPVQYPTEMAIDADGYVWFDDTSPSTPAMYQLSPQGAGTSYSVSPGNSSPGSESPVTFAISPKDNSIWVLNAYAVPSTGDDANVVEIYQNNTTSLTYLTEVRSSSFYIRSAEPFNIVFDANGNATFLTQGNYANYLNTDTGQQYFWVADSTGVANAMYNPPTTSTTYWVVEALSYDSNQNLWMATWNYNNKTHSSVSGSQNAYRFSSSALNGTATKYSDGTFTGTLLAGANGTMWYGTGTAAGTPVTSLTSSGAGPSCSGGGLSYGSPLATDGAGNLWVGNGIPSTTAYQTLSAFNPIANGVCTALTSSNGISNGVDPSQGAYSVLAAVDSSGNLWSLNSGYFYNTSIPTLPSGYDPIISFTQFLGLATPAVTPLNPAYIGKTPQ